MNPLTWLELRTRVRERRLWIMALFVALIPFLISLLILATMHKINEPGETGMLLAYFAIFAQAGILIILSPLAAAQRIAQEREQRTYAALINSPLTPSQIVRGKLCGAWSFVLWLGMLTLPFMMIAALWGGLPPWAVLACFAANLFMALMLSSIALGFSGLFGRSLSAYLASGAFLFLWCCVLPIIGLLLGELLDKGNGFPEWIPYVFFYPLPCAPQVLITLRAIGETDYVLPWLGNLCTGLGVWSILLFLGYRLAIRGVKREVY